jgi:hypothetical protein
MVRLSVGEVARADYGLEMLPSTISDLHGEYRS